VSIHIASGVSGCLRLVTDSAFYVDALSVTGRTGVPQLAKVDQLSAMQSSQAPPPPWLSQGGFGLVTKLPGAESPGTVASSNTVRVSGVT